MRGAKSEDENGKICPIRMVSAWAVDNGVSLGQEKVGEKSNEIKAIPKLLKILDLEGCIVTIDAIGCQHKIVKEVIENKGDYLIAVKENQQKLHKSLSSWFSEVDIEGFKKKRAWSLSSYKIPVLHTRKPWTWTNGKENM